ncbi:hypothetical protein [Caulobacter sp. DWR1-3-2b1]|uniref:hypothetical protein n=1 Tax=Caulobacter sp. DWR1-3-2b1 TaxID=2804670 RepID=UPI003CFA24E2
MPRKNSRKSRLYSFKRIDLSGAMPAGLAPRPWLAVEVDCITGLVVEARLSSDPMALMSDKGFWKKLRDHRSDVRPEVSPARSRSTPTRGRPKGDKSRPRTAGDGEPFQPAHHEAL